MDKTSSERVKVATHVAMKGMSIADISEVLGHSATTVTRWLDRGGVHSAELHARDFVGLRCGHIQLDELVSKVRRWGQRVCGVAGVVGMACGAGVDKLTRTG